MARPAEPASQRLDIKAAKRRVKVRSAWIAFAGRIVAQILGAAATVGFALIVLDGNRAPATSPSLALAGTTDVSVARPVRSTPTVAVLPFHTYAATSEHNHIADAISDLLVTELAQGREIGVTSLTSTLRFRGRQATVPQIGRELGASHVIEGSVAVENGRARVIAQLIDASSDQHVWAQSYDTELGDALTLEQRISEEIARDVRKALGDATR